MGFMSAGYPIFLFFLLSFTEYSAQSYPFFFKRKENSLCRVAFFYNFSLSLSPEPCCSECYNRWCTESSTARRARRGVPREGRERGVSRVVIHPGKLGTG